MSDGSRARGKYRVRKEKRDLRISITAKLEKEKMLIEIHESQHADGVLGVGSNTVRKNKATV